MVFSEVENRASEPPCVDGNDSRRVLRGGLLKGSLCPNPSRIEAGNDPARRNRISSFRVDGVGGDY